METKVTTDNYFGGCPECGQGGYVNVRKNHFGVCGTHQVYWPIGYNLFSSWQDEGQAEWDKNAKMINSFTLVKPILPLNDDQDNSKEQSEDENAESSQMEALMADAYQRRAKRDEELCRNLANALADVVEEQPCV